MEIKLVPSRVGWRAMFQFVDGGLGDVFFVPVAIDEARRSISFTYPDLDGSTVSASGQVGASSLKLQLRFSNGVVSSSELVRGESYWDR